MDVGGTSIKFGVYSVEGKLVRKLDPITTYNTETHNGIVEAVLSVAKAVKDEVAGVAISSAGIVNTEEGKIIYSGYTIPGYTNTNWKQLIKDETGLDCEVENDVNAAALGEKWLGALQDVSNGVCLTVGTGVGGAVLVNGSIHSGTNYTTGEIGYMDIGEDKLQDLASTSSLVKRVAARTGEELNGFDIFEKAKAGETIYEEEIQNMVDYLSKGLVNIIYLINPEKVVLGGGVMAQQDYLEPMIQEAVAKRIEDPFFLSTEIAFAELGNDAGLLGALYHFLVNKKEIIS